MVYNDDTSHMSWQWPEEDLYRFWGRKVKFGLQTFYRFATITPFPCGIQWWYWWYASYVLTMTWRGPLLILRSKLFTISAQSLLFLSAYNDDTSYMYWSLPKTDLYWFRVKRSKVKIKFGLQTVYRFRTITL